MKSNDAGWSGDKFFRDGKQVGSVLPDDPENPAGAWCALINGQSTVRFPSRQVAMDHVASKSSEWAR